MEVNILYTTSSFIELECKLIGINIYLKINRYKYPGLIGFLKNSKNNKGRSINYVYDLGKEVLRLTGKSNAVYNGIDCLNYLNARSYYIKPYYRKPKRWY